MDNALYVGLSRQMTLQRQLDVAANNLANLDTAGFKVEQLMLQSDPMRPEGGRSRLDPIRYVIDDGVARAFTPGAMENTGSSLDLAVEGDGFFQVQTPEGVRYTRDGRFSLDAQNRLTTQAGDPVLDASGSPITVDPTKGPLTIAKTGRISQGAQSLGKVGVMRFTNLSGLSKQGDGLFTSAETPAAAADAGVLQGYLERSNVQPVAEVTHLVEINRAYERISNLLTSTHDLSRSAIQRLGKAA